MNPLSLSYKGERTYIMDKVKISIRKEIQKPMMLLAGIPILILGFLGCALTFTATRSTLYQNMPVIAVV